MKLGISALRRPGSCSSASARHGFFSDFAGPVEVDYLGGRKRNLRKSKRDRGGPRGPDGKRPVIGAKDLR